ncbi:MAG: FtsX-like permease family protein [Lachnospiraceae bacterium]
MKSMMRKTTLREIKQSFGRYLAILAIVALGVGFFAGLKVTKSVMLESADEYLKEKQFYDYRLLSTLGFEEEDVEAIAAKEDVRAAEGAMSADVIFLNAQGNENVIKAHSLLNDINGVELVAGRLPKQDDECVVDSNLYGESAIGTRIVFSDNNAQEDLDNFTYKEYTITGIVQSSYYIQFERGNSALGNGRVSGFMYLLPGGFSMEYYTEIFVKFDEDYPIYSDEYDSYMEEKEALWEEYCEAQGERRYQAILADANAELADAEKELADKKAEAEQELADAKQELTDADNEIADGEEKLADGEKEIADAEKTIADKEQELADAKQEIADNEALLAEKKQEYEDGMEAFTSGKKEVESKQNELSNALAQITEGESALAKAQAQIDAMAGIYPDEVVAEAQAQLDAQKAELEEKKAQVEAGMDQINAADAQLNSAYMELSAGGVQITDAEAEIADAKAQIEEGETQLADAKKELEEAKTTLEENRQELLDAKEEVADGWEEYNDAYAEFEDEIADAEDKLAEARADIEDIKKPDTYVLGRDTNIGYVCYESDSSIVEGIAIVFPVFFFLVAALVCVTTMNRMVEEQRTQIGVLKALGYGEGTIMGKYLFYSGSAAIAGCVIGFLGGTYFFPYVIWYAYGIMYRLGDMVYVFDWKLAVISLICSLICSMGTTWLSCRHELKEVAAGLMRPKAPKAGKRVFLEYVPFIWKRLKFLDKVSVRNVIRYKKRFFMMIIGISGCTALLVTGFGVRDSVTNIANQQFEEIQIYDFGITLQNGYTDTLDVDTEKVLQLVEDYGGEYMFAMEATMDLVTDGQVKSVNLIVAKQPEQIGGYINLHTDSGNAIAYPGDEEIVICKKLADTYGIAVGDSIVLRDDTMKEIRVTVSGICENYIYNYVYLNPQTYEKAFGEAEYKNIYAKIPEETDAHEVSAAIMKEDNVTAVTVNADMLVRFSSMMGSMNYIVFVIIGCAAALAFIVLYNLNNINITERVREIATIKVLGFYKKETTSYVFRENMVLTGIGCVVGLGLGKLLHMYVMHEVVIDMISFDVHVQGISYLFSIILTFVFNWIVNRMMTGKLDKINMAESLKSVD